MRPGSSEARGAADLADSAAVRARSAADKARGAGLLIVPLAQRAELEAHIAAGAPHECCGLLLGTRAGSPSGANRVAVVTRVVSVRNAERLRPRQRFVLHPQEHLRAEWAAREQGLEVLGIWHNHPEGRARPSAADRAGAWPGLSWLIAGCDARGRREWRTWRLQAGHFTEEALRSRPPRAVPRD